MRFGAVIPVFNEWRFLNAAAGQMLKVCDRVIVLRSKNPFSGASATLLPAPIVDSRIEIIEGDWPDEGATRNAGMEILQDCDYIFTTDSDEIFTLGDLNFLKDTAERGHRAIACYTHTYWKTIRWEIQPPERIAANVVAHRDTRFRFMRVIDGGQHVLGQQFMHHLSYVRTDEELKEKFRLYAHAHQIRNGWFENVWQKWDSNTNMRDLHPINPSSFSVAAPVQNDELEKILIEFGAK